MDAAAFPSFTSYHLVWRCHPPLALLLLGEIVTTEGRLVRLIAAESNPIPDKSRRIRLPHPQRIVEETKIATEALVIAGQIQGEMKDQVTPIDETGMTMMVINLADIVRSEIEIDREGIETTETGQEDMMTIEREQDGIETNESTVDHQSLLKKTKKDGVVIVKERKKSENIARNEIETLLAAQDSKTSPLLLPQKTCPSKKIKINPTLLLLVS